jgi:hypothetical protein
MLNFVILVCGHPYMVIHISSSMDMGQFIFSVVRLPVSYFCNQVHIFFAILGYFYCLVCGLVESLVGL